MLLFRKVSEISRKIGQSRETPRDIETEKKIAAFVDAEYYLNRNADVRDSGLDPVTHYDCFGWKEGRDPSPSFSTQDYLSKNPNLLKSKINPLSHFVDSIRESAEKPNISEEVINVISSSFDAEFYSDKYSEWLPIDRDPVEYFCEHGWRKGHDPNRWFSTSHYLTTNVDIKESGVNPFWHYLVAGREEGRTSQSHHCWQIDAASNLQPLEKTKRDWLHTKAMPRVFKPAELQAIFAREFSNELVLTSFSHDDYRVVPGGVQLCIGIEKTQSISQGIRHLNLHPWQMLPTLADKNSDPILCLVLDGEMLGHARTSIVIDAFASVICADVSIVCHHLVGHSIEGVVSIARSVGVSSCSFWLHDYFGICTSYTLMRNGVLDCGAPDPNSNACTLCVFGDERRSQSDRFMHLFESLDVHLISPSSIALELWNQRSQMRPKTSRVLPHVNLQKRDLRQGCALEFPKPIRIAFIGALSPHKGWPIFEKLKKLIGDDPRYEFWVFSATELDIPDVTHVHVHAQSGDPYATMTALREAQIDLVVHWAVWRETFSFSTFEALAAGAFVITNANSGNVAKAVSHYDAGLVLEEPEDLYEIARSEDLINLANRSRKFRNNYEYEMTFSDMAVSQDIEKTAAA